MWSLTATFIYPLSLSLPFSIKVVYDKVVNNTKTTSSSWLLARNYGLVQFTSKVRRVLFFSELDECI